jgi:hypothetical protein
MTMSPRRPIRGLLIGSVVVPLCYWLAMTADATAHEVRFNLVHSLRELMIITAFGVPMALAAALLWGAPVVYVLHRLGVLRAATVVVTGAVGGALVGLLFAKCQGGDLFRVRMPLSLTVVLGALAGGTCWWAGRGRVAPGETDGG